MYSNRFIASVRVNGKILRENQGIVSLPFGAEYEILVKNMHSRRAMVKITVDGEDIGGGSRLIIGPNDSTVIERFIKNGNFSSGNKLKFIERTGGIEGHRGIKQEDGLIRCEFWVEKEVPQEIQAKAMRAPMGRTGSSRSRPFRSFLEEETRGGAVMDFNDTGITVAGSESHQQFYSAQGFAVETNSHVIVLQLRGEVGGVAAVKPVTVDLKPVCSSCGKKNKPNVKFCADCGTALLLI